VTGARRLLRAPLVIAASLLLFAGAAAFLTLLSLAAALWLACTTCRSALTADHADGYIRNGITNLERHLAEETNR
jgi:hypothetical protein